MMNEPPASQSALIAILNRRPLRIAAWVLVVAVGATGVVGGVHRGLAGQPDWRTFVAESQYAWEHGAIDPTTKMFAYLPAAYFFLWPFTVALPHPIGLIAFVAVNASAAVISIWLVRRYWFGPDAQRGARRFVWPLLLAIAHFQHVLQANQFTLMILALCVGGLALVMQRRDAAGGFLLGIAACLKVTPICFAALFLLRRQWNALAGMVLALVVCNLVPSLLVFGADGAVREHAAWLRRVDAYANRRFIEDPWLRVAKHRANCSLAVVLSRWLRQPPDATTQVVLRGDDVPPGVVAATRAALRPDEHLSLDPMPERDRPWSIERIDLGDRRKYPRFHVADLSPTTIRVIWWILISTSAALLALATWRTRRMSAAHGDFAALSALWLLFMLWPSPMMRDYYLALAFPALAVVSRAAFDAPRNRIGRTGLTALIVAVVASFAGVCCLGSNIANWYGIHLFTLVALGVATAVVWFKGTPSEGSIFAAPSPDHSPTRNDRASEGRRSTRDSTRRLAASNLPNRKSPALN